LSETKLGSQSLCHEISCLETGAFRRLVIYLLREKQNFPAGHGFSSSGAIG